MGAILINLPIDPKITEAVRWLLSDPPIGRCLSILRERFGLTTSEIIQVWRLAAELRR